jgi:hypothetical protein
MGLEGLDRLVEYRYLGIAQVRAGGLKVNAAQDDFFLGCGLGRGWRRRWW